MLLDYLARHIFGCPVTSMYSLMYHICIYVNRLMNEEDVIRPMVRNHKYASLFQRSQNMTVNETVTIVNDTRNICIVNLC